MSPIIYIESALGQDLLMVTVDGRNYYSKHNLFQWTHVRLTIVLRTSASCSAGSPPLLIKMEMCHTCRLTWQSVSHAWYMICAYYTIQWMHETQYITKFLHCIFRNEILVTPNRTQWLFFTVTITVHSSVFNHSYSIIHWTECPYAHYLKNNF